MFVHAALPNTRFDAIKPVFAGALMPASMGFHFSPVAAVSAPLLKNPAQDTFVRRHV